MAHLAVLHFVNSDVVATMPASHYDPENYLGVVSKCNEMQENGMLPLSKDSTMLPVIFLAVIELHSVSKFYQCQAIIDFNLRLVTSNDS